LRRLARLDAVEVAETAPSLPTAKLLAGRGGGYLPRGGGAGPGRGGGGAGVSGLAERRPGWGRERAALAVERARAEAKLANPSFLEKAPANVVAKARERLGEVDQALAKVRAPQPELAGG